MGRILAIDYGLKRTGLALTDPLQIIASPYDTVLTVDLVKVLTLLIPQSEIEAVVIGLPVDLLNRATDATAPVERFVKSFKKKFPHTPIHTIDERFSSKMASQAILSSGVGKLRRSDKNLVDKVSAAIILQDYLLRKNP